MLLCKCRRPSMPLLCTCQTTKQQNGKDMSECSIFARGQDRHSWTFGIHVDNVTNKAGSNNGTMWRRVGLPVIKVKLIRRHMLSTHCTNVRTIYVHGLCFSLQIVQLPYCIYYTVVLNWARRTS